MSYRVTFGIRPVWEAWPAAVNSSRLPSRQPRGTPRRDDHITHDHVRAMRLSLLSECGLRVQGADLPQARFAETAAVPCFSLDLVLGSFLFAGLTESGLRASFEEPGRRCSWRRQFGRDGHCGAVPERDCQCSLVIHR
jgi:hypothetical protein